MAISLISGVVNSAVYVDGYTPHGPEVLADFQQLITKANETATQVNTDSATTDLNAIAVVDNADDIDLLETRMTLVEGASGGIGIDIESGSTYSPDLDTIWGLSFIAVYHGPGSQTIVLPEGQFSPSSAVPKITVCNSSVSGTEFVRIFLDGFDWADGTTGTLAANYFDLEVGESVTFMPFRDGSTFLWGPIAGQTYSDIQP